MQGHPDRLPNFSTFDNQVFLKASSAVLIGPMQVTRTGVTPQYSKIDFFNWLMLGRPNASR